MPLDKFFINKDFNASRLRETVSDYIDKRISLNNIEYEKIGAIVIATPGIVDNKTGDIILNPQHEDLHTINLMDYLRERYNLPILIKNDVNMAAIREAKFLKKENCNDLFFISCGLGLGSALILGGKLYEGENCSEGEINYYMFTEDRDRIENKVSINALIKLISESLEEGNSETSLIPGKMSFGDIVSVYELKDPVVTDAIKK